MQKLMKNRKFSLILLTAILIINITACGKNFDAQGYVQATLDLIFQGEVSEALKFNENASKADLEAQHDAEIENFVDNNIISGMDVNELMREEFIDACGQIFSVMQYEVQDAEKIDRRNYEVTVEIAPVDIFPRFVEGVKADSEEIMQKAKNGEYKGTKEEINAQMQTEFIRHSHELLTTYAGEVAFGEKIKVKLHVKADKKKDFHIVNEDLDQLIIKILRLDEIQD